MNPTDYHAKFYAYELTKRCPSGSVDKLASAVARAQAAALAKQTLANGPHTLNDHHNRVHIIEEAFQRLMFDNTNFGSLT
jgi:hypothetical protein